MALLNYLSQGTYSVADSVLYSKQQSTLRFVLRVFSDSSKNTELASKQFDLGRYTTSQLLGPTPLTSPPEGYQQGIGYLVGIGATGDWEGRDRTIAVCSNGDEWGFWMLAPNQVFYDSANDTYFKLNLNTLEQIVVYPLDDSRLWDAWFASGLVFSETSNLFKQVYLFLKSRSGFETVTDA